MNKDTSSVVFTAILATFTGLAVAWFCHIRFSWPIWSLLLLGLATAGAAYLAVEPQKTRAGMKHAWLKVIGWQPNWAKVRSVIVVLGALSFLLMSIVMDVGLSILLVTGDTAKALSVPALISWAVLFAMLIVVVLFISFPDAENWVIARMYWLTGLVFFPLTMPFMAARGVRFLGKRVKEIGLGTIVWNTAFPFLVVFLVCFLYLREFFAYVHGARQRAVFTATLTGFVIGLAVDVLFGFAYGTVVGSMSAGVVGYVMYDLVRPRIAHLLPAHS